MLPVTEAALRASFSNASRSEAARIALPENFETLDWSRLDYLGWHDPKLARRAYAVVPQLDGGVIGIVLRQADASPRARALCAWCNDVTLPNEVVLFTARRSGPAGRNGSTVGTLICEGFQCSRNVRVLPPLAYEGYDVEAARLRSIAALQLRAASFAAEV